MNIEKMREEFEAWAVTSAYLGLGSKEDLLFDNADDNGYDHPEVHLAWLGWQASRAAIEVELQPACHPMSEDPPFPFTGDIFVGGKVIVGAAWCAGYWQAKRSGCVDRKSVTHWKQSNHPVTPPAA